VPKATISSSDTVHCPKSNTLSTAKSSKQYITCHSNSSGGPCERPLISTEVVPVERIHLSKYVVTDKQVVAATLGHEVVEQVGDGG